VAEITDLIVVVVVVILLVLLMVVGTNVHCFMLNLSIIIFTNIMN